MAELVTSTGNAERVGTILYALGWTQHSIGVQMIRTAAMLQLLLGNVGRPGGGINALRGHSNIQGATDTAGVFDILPGYLKTPAAPLQSLKEYLDANTPKALGPSMNYWQNYPKFMVSVLKACYGKAATKENDFGYSWLPKIDGNYSWMYIFDDMYRGDSARAGGKEPGPQGLVTFGMNPVGIGPNSPKMIAALAKLKWLVVVENHQIETATFWKAPKEYGGPDPSKIATEVFQLPAATFAEKDGSFTNSARWIQWKWKAADPPGEARTDQEILARIFLAVRELYRKEGGAFPEAVLNVDWAYSNPVAPDLAEVLKELNGKALEDIHDPVDKTKVAQGRRSAGRRLRPAAGRRLDDVRQLADVGRLHGSGQPVAAAQSRPTRRTASGCTTTGASPGRPTGASCTTAPPPTAKGKPWDATRAGIKWNGSKWVGDVPDMKPDAPPGTFGAFIMLPEGVGKLFAPLNDGPFPEHYEAIEAPVENLAASEGDVQSGRDAASSPTRTSMRRRPSSRSSARPTASPRCTTTGPSTSTA